MHYIVYKTVNLINGKYYIGKHQTESINDGYLGSGKLLKLAISKYGVDNFKRTILFTCCDQEMMDFLESEIVDQSVVDDPKSYNLKLGGEGGFDFINNNGLVTRDSQIAWQAAGVKAFAENMRDHDFREEFSRKISEGLKNSVAYANISRDYFGTNNPMFGKTHSDKSKLMMSESTKGIKNPMYGKVWIYSTAEMRSIRVDKSELSSFISSGWIRGRKIKF